jgi:hypothetical protein
MLVAHRFQNLETVRIKSAVKSLSVGTAAVLRNLEQLDIKEQAFNYTHIMIMVI